jgi:hypothetical protein
MPAEPSADRDREPEPDRAAERIALARTYAWFEHHSGWAPPDPDTLADWLADGVCRCPDECLVAPDVPCPHGLASWAVVLRDLEAFDRGRGH